MTVHAPDRECGFGALVKAVSTADFREAELFEGLAASI